MIFWRQKVLLALLEKAPKQTASKIQFLKWLFLLKEEENIHCHGRFYDFLPYKYGPFSFSVYRDISEMESWGWIESDEEYFHFKGTSNGSTHDALSPKVLGLLEKIIGNYGELPQEVLVEYVYQKYPWYASRSSIRKPYQQIKSKDPEPGIYSLGYEGLSIDAFLNIILEAGIRCVIDSRNNPISRKYGFSKTLLEKKCLDIKVEYYHFPDVGIPSDIRHKIHNKSTLWDRYRQDILPNASDTLKLLTDITLKRPSMVICFEKSPEDCHRHILAEEISHRTRLPVFHYDSETRNWQKA